MAATKDAIHVSGDRQKMKEKLLRMKTQGRRDVEAGRQGNQRSEWGAAKKYRGE